MGLVDTVMVGRVSALDLAAVGLGNLFFYSITVFGRGLLLALEPLVSQAFGAKDEDAIEVSVQRGLLVAIALAIVVSLVLAASGPMLALLRQPPELIPVATRYIHALIWSMLPFYGFIALRQVLQGVHWVRPVVWAIASANLINVVANWILIYGNLGFPAMGSEGSGWATTLSRWEMLCFLLFAASRTLKPYFSRLRRDALRWKPLRRMLGLGAPVGVHLAMEFAAFGAAGIAMGWFGTLAVASHHVALSLASLAFHVPLGIAQAAAVKVGASIGRRRPSAARRLAGTSVLLASVIMTASGLAFLLFSRFFAGLFTEDPEVLGLAAALIQVAGVFQLVDGLQAVLAGVLRGAADTLVPVILTMAGFWAAGMPVGLFLAFGAGLGPAGLWWGLAIGLGVVALLLLGRSWARFRRPLERYEL